jgi:hypothetical protein
LYSKYHWTVSEFISNYTTQESLLPQGRTADWRARQIKTVFIKSVDDWRPFLKENIIPQEHVVEYVGETLRGEVEKLIKYSKYFGKWVHNDQLEADMGLAVEDIGALAPTLQTFILGLSSHNRSNWAIGSTRMPTTLDFRLLTIVVLLCSGNSRNNSSWFQTVIGVHLNAMGTKRRAMDLLSSLGVVTSYRTILGALDTIATAQRASDVE